MTSKSLLAAEDGFRADDDPFPILSQPVIGLEKGKQWAEAATDVSGVAD
jgi:hypothetical protein